MAIEKMTFAHISGPVEELDDLLLRVLGSGMLQPEYAGKLSEYSVGSPMPLQNPYAGPLGQVEELATRLGVPLKMLSIPPPAKGDRELYLHRGREQLEELSASYQELMEEQRETQERIASCDTALHLLARMGEADLDYGKLAESSFLQIRFGRLPPEQIPLINALDQPITLQVLQQEEQGAWCLVLYPKDREEETAPLLETAGFAPVDLPQGDTKEPLRGFLPKALEAAKAQAARAQERLEQMAAQGSESLCRLYSGLVTLHDAFDLRKYAVTLRGKFHLIGYLLTKDKAAFAALVEEGGGASIQTVPCHDDIPRLQTPVRLRNSPFARPFQMFVEMYGSPGYTGIDPTPFVALSYSLLFGMMFGDVGQGLCIVLLGWLLHKLKGMSLGPIMMRIGIVSTLFGFVYGSVFGYEHLLDGLYRRLGFAQKPVEIFNPATTNVILVAAVGVGVVAILTVMLLNICVGIKQRDVARIFLSNNGIPGLVFFGAVVAAVLGGLSGRALLSPPYVGFLLVLPLLIIFFKEPLHRLISFYARDSVLQHSRHLADSIRFSKLDDTIPALFRLRYVYARFGRLPTGSYEKLRLYAEDPFVIHPLKSDRDYIWCIYTMAAGDRQQVDAIFHDLFFERVYIPGEVLEDIGRTEAFIRDCIDGKGDVSAAGVPRKITLWRRMFPDGLGSFFAESFFEMFEVLLSFITNTMSFLRVGGFILSHAGMMSVVMALSEMAGAGVSPVVVVVGNLFVMALEGLIVGIQVLRLEFYEMFSRFYDGGGEAFRPVALRS